MVVWFVTPATGNSDLKDCAFGWAGAAPTDTPRIEVNPDQREFRTCFTLWSYDSNDRFLVDNADATLEEFENAWQAWPMPTTGTVHLQLLHQ